ncbi:MAG: M48 family metallopeptidase [Candidatus Omnitrophica bacterium]|nr:M48 family metallopeptidase [Candidatus Omnitrophota bacterium]
MEKLPTPRGEIAYVLTRSRGRRRISITVTHDGRVQVSAPFSTAEKDIQNFLVQKTRWIEKYVARGREQKKIADEQKFKDGGEFLFQGQFYPLKIVPAENSRIRKIDFNGEKWTVEVPTALAGAGREAFIHDRLIEWYRRQAEEILGGIVFQYSRVLNVKPEKITVRTQKRLWGSCNFQKKAINLNWKIILTPPEVRDYVVIHELCHLIHHNHSAVFWNKVAEFVPNFKARRKWLKDNHGYLTLENPGIAGN